uniref:Heavy metal transport/detoxification protein n=1 Tax=Cyanothece sp. (strain PCC 7425 / ATCC 29141) TaxID=395961 RepID=B8HQN3_CYAP4
MSLQLQVPTIVCQGCADAITNAIKEVDATAQVQVGLEAKTVAVETTAPEGEIRSAITQLGHEVAA